MIDSAIKFSAEGMRELTNQSQRTLEEGEFQSTKEKIVAAAKQGHYSLNLTLEYDTTIKTLKTLGFAVNYGNPPTESYSYGKIPRYYEVSWFDE